jgi:multiple sugar transport system substrate-binding protein
MKNFIKLLITAVVLSSTFSPAFAAEKDKTKITVWAMGYEGTQIGKMARKFEELHPDVEVVTQAIPWGAAHEKLLTSIIGAVPPDVSQMGTTWVPEFQSMNAFEPLDEYLEKSKLNEEDFFESSFGIGKIKGKTYGMPWYVDTRVLYYRKDIIKKAGFDNPPKNWDELLKLASSLARDTNKDGKIDHYGIALPVKDWQVFLPFLWQNGGSILSEDQERITVKDKKFAETVEFYGKCYENNAAPKEDPGYDLLWAFREGVYPMFISGPWMIDIIRKQVPEIEGKWGVAMLPEKEKHTSFVGGSHLVVFKDSPNKEMAWKFVEFMSQPENQLEWFEIAGSLPSNMNSWNSGYFSNKPFVQVYGQQMLDTKSPPNIPEWEEIASVVNERLEQALLDKKTIPEMQELLYNDIATVLQDKDKGSKNILIWFWCFALLILLLTNGYVKRLHVKQSQVALNIEGGKETASSREVPGGLPGKGYKVVLIPYLFVLPALITLLVFLFFPIISSFFISLTNWNIYSFSDVTRLRFIGFDNYVMLFKDKIFWQALVNTFVFAGVSIPLNIIMALFLAVIIDKKYIQNKAIFRSGYFMPVVTTLVAVAVVWRWLYNPEYGLINYLLGLIGIEKQTWLSNPYLALPSLIIMSVWKNFGYNMVIILAGLQTIPASLYEAASVDGADSWQTFMNITLPSLKPTLFFVMIMTTIGSLQFFAEPYIMTKGGPLNKTISMVMYMYNNGFKYFKFGYGTAIAYVLFLFILMFTLIQIFYKNKLEAK